ncbi:hypothetical protein HYY70_02965 [Candidatus Woesearchaeota archaeon]|nr:hypothetical protein [Candidatus Woesearchaeota archaeon]
MQDYVEFTPRKAEVKVLKPNIKKVFLKNLIGVVSFLLLASVILVIFNSLVGLDIFFVIFEVFGIAISQSALLGYMILIILAISALLLGLSYLANANLRYEFYQDKLILYENNLLVFVNSAEIPYKNIVKISYDNSGVFNKIFNSGAVILDTSGIKSNTIKLNFIDNAEQTAQYIHSLISEFASIQQAVFTENYKIGKIVDKF